MHAVEAPKRLLENLPSLINDLDSFQQLNNHQWKLFFVDDTTVNAAYCEHFSVLVFTTPLFIPQADDLLKLFGTLLTFNSMFKQTQRCRMARDFTSGGIELQLDIPLNGLELPALIEALRTFMKTKKQLTEELKNYDTCRSDNSSDIMSAQLMTSNSLCV